MNSRFQIFTSTAALAFVALSSTSFGQSALIREADDITGMGSMISSISGSAANGIGGYAVRVLDGSVEWFWGNHLGGPGSILFDESLTVNNLAVVSYEGNFGLSNAGVLAIGPNGTDTVSGVTTLDCLWTFDATTSVATEIAREDELIPGLMGEVYRFNSNARISQSGIPQWRAGINDSMGVAAGGGLVQGTSPIVLVRTGDAAPAGLPVGTLADNNAGSADHAISANGTFVLNELDTDLPTAADGFITINGALAMTSAMTLMGEAEAIPASSGGLAGENWDNFDRMGINESGDFFFSGDTDGDTTTDEFIALNGNIIYREGDTIDGEVVSGSLANTWATMNENSDIAYAWNISGGTLEALFVNDTVVLREGDAMDWDGDGIVEATSILTDFTGTNELRMSDRNAGLVTLFFTADVDVSGVILEGFFRMEVPATGGFTNFCNGDGGDQLGCTDCPCGNNQIAGSIGGCLNSSGTGAELLASGTPSVAGDTLRIELSGAPANSFALLSSGAAQAPTNPMNPCFGLNSGIQSPTFDGLRCAVQDFQRHGSRPVDANGDVGVTTNGWGPPSGPPGGLISANGFVSGQTRHFQAIYREDPMLGCATGLNTTQGVTVTIEP